MLNNIKVGMMLLLLFANGAYGETASNICENFLSDKPYDHRRFITLDGPLVDPIFSDPNGNLSPKLIFSKSYLIPYGQSNDDPIVAENFSFDFESGKPTENYRSTLPKENTHFSLLLQYAPKLEFLELLYLVIGQSPATSTRRRFQVEVPEQLILLPAQELTKGYILIDTPTLNKANDPAEVAVKYNQKNGTIGGSYLTCWPIGVHPEPICTLHITEQGFLALSSFNQKYLNRVDRIEELTRNFINCSILKGNEHDN